MKDTDNKWYEELIQETIKVNKDQFLAFCEILDSPPKPNKNLIKLFNINNKC